MVFIPIGKQKEAIDEKIGNILVSAAAGSGKTTVLVERIVSELMAGKLTLDKVLVVTFTNEAADKAKTDIEKNIRDKIGQPEFRSANGDEAVRRLKSQLDLIPGAYIQTMNSFCNRVIKEKGYLCADSDKADLMDPGNSVLDGNELDVLLNEAAGRALKLQYAVDTSDAFYELTDMFGNGRTDDCLLDDIVKTYKKLRSLPDYLEALERSLKQREESDNKGEVIGASEITERIIELCTQIDGDLINDLRARVGDITFLKPGKANLKKIDERREEFDKMLADVYACCREIISFSEEVKDPMARLSKIKEAAKDISYIGFPSKADWRSDEEVKLLEDYKIDFGPVAAFALLTKSIHGQKTTGYKECTQAYKLPDSFADFLGSDTSALLEMQKKRTLRSRVYAQILSKTDEEYAKIKMGMHGMDFADQEHLAKMILDTEEGSGYYRNKFTEIYIDEYQDNSCLQDAVIAMIARKEGNVFRVGDVKQSIYKFRYAEPSLFIRKMEEYADERSSGKLITLNHNLRSSYQILEFVNDIFSQVMTKDGAEIEYDEDQRLNPAEGKTEEGERPRVLISGYKNASELSPIFQRDVLSEVQRYIGMGYAPSDICILSRVRETASACASYLNENGYPASYVDSMSIFSDNDINSLINIIICVGNELRDEYLTGVLISSYPMSNFTVNELAKIHAFSINTDRDYSYIPLIERLRLYARSGDDEPLKARTNGFLQWFSDLRYNTVITDIGELTDRIYKETGIASLTGERGNKMVRFRDWLCDNFTRYGSDIASVASSLEHMKIDIGDSTSVEDKRRDKDKIACMTIHSSKGLDFKCVIVARLFNKQAGNRDASGFVYDGQMGLVSDDYLPQTVTRKKSLEKIIYEDHEYIASNAEEIRLLYVALTRAKEHMSIVMPLKLDSKSFAGLVKSIALYKDLKFSRKFWLCCKENAAQKLEFPLFAAILRTEEGERLLEQLRDNCVEIECDSPKCHTGYKGPVILFDPSDVGDQDNGDASEGEDIHEDDVFEEEPGDRVTGDLDKVLSHSDNMIELCGEIGGDGKPVFKPYRYKDSFNVPFKVSVTAITSGDIARKDSINLTLNDFSYYMDRQRGYVGDSPFETGTFVHKLFRFIDMEKASDDDTSFEDIIDGLISEGIIKSVEKEKAMSFEEGIRSFARSDIGQRLIKADFAGDADYERPIVFATPVGEDHALVQGVIDCMFMEGSEAVILDYKTTRYNEPDTVTRAAKARDDYSFQVDLYAAAVEAAGIKVKERYLYLVRYGEFVPLT